MQIILELKQQRYERAKLIADLCCQNVDMTTNYQKIINELYPSYPSPSWLTNFCQSKEPHISGVFCNNSAGFKLKPMIIIPVLKKLPSELSLFKAFFTS